MARSRSQGPQPGLTRGPTPKPAASPVQEWRGTATRTLSQDLRTTARQCRQHTRHHSTRTHTPHTTNTHGPTPATAPAPLADPSQKCGEGLARHQQPHQQRTPAGIRREMRPGPSARIGEEAPTTTTNRPQPAMAGNCAQGPEPGMARDRPPRQQQTRARNGGELHRGPSARIGEGPPTNISGRPQLGMAGSCPQDPQQGLARGRPPPPAADPSQEWRGTTPKALSQGWRGRTNHHYTHTNKAGTYTPQKQKCTHTKDTTKGTMSTTRHNTTHRYTRTKTHRPTLPVQQQQHPPTPVVIPSQELRGTAPRALSQDWPGTVRHR